MGAGTGSRLSEGQFFIERPPTNLTVIEGQKMVLKCQVGKLEGSVQWTRNGFAMGKKI